MLSALAVLAGTAHAQFPGMDEDARIGIMAPDGQMQYLPTQEEMAQVASRGPDLSVFAEYAQRRLELASMVTEVVYVDDDAPVGGDGTNWQSAHQSLQDALAQDYSDRLVEIRMAQGTYRADRFNGSNTGDPEATFNPGYEDTDDPTGIFRITGGYAGLGATDPNQNDPEQFPTVITGDLSGDDGSDFTNYEDNTLVLFDGFNSELLGLVMEHAVQAMKGGGSTIDGCLVQHHAGTDSEGAAFLTAPVLVVKRSTFFNNRSGLFGGAIYSRSPNTALVSNRFLSNQAHHGGAFFHYFFSSPGQLSVLQNNYFAANIAAGENSSIGGASAMYTWYQISSGNTVVSNRSVDGPGGGYGSISGFGAVFGQRYNAYDVFHMNEGHTGSGVHEQLDSLPYSVRPPSANTFPLRHYLRGNFVQDWESSSTNDPTSYASLLDTVGQNSGEEVLFVDLAGPDGIIGTLDDDPTPRPDSPNIDRMVETAQVEIALLDYADLNENGIVDEPLPFDLIGNPRSTNTSGIGDPDGGIDAGAIEYAGDPDRFDYDRPISGRRTDPMDGCEGDEPIRLYVNASGPVSGDGSSWDSPLLELYEALDIARSRCGSVEIWLVSGTYLPDFSVPLWRASFRPTSNVTILGGFAGWEDKADQRDPVANETTLSGDPLGNDDLDDYDSLLDNAHRVLVFTGTRAGGIIDGVTISGGAARAFLNAGFYYVLEGCVLGTGPVSRGAAITVLNGDATIRNCVIENCYANFAVLASVGGIGTLRLDLTEVRTDLMVGPSCFSRPEVELISSEGVDSLLAPAAGMELRNMTLRESDNQVPFDGSLSGNTNFVIASSDLTLTGDGPVSVISTARSLTATDSMLRGFRGSATHRVRIANSTLLGFMGVYPVIPHPESTTFEIENSAVIGFLRTLGELNYQPVARYCLAGLCQFPVCEEFIFLPLQSLSVYFVDPLPGGGHPFFNTDGDYRLVPGSPAINIGSNAFVESDTDLDGNPRIIGSVVDRGAYEFTGTCTGDVNGDGVIDLADLNRVLANFDQQTPFGDADGDGSVTMTDLNIVLAAFGQNCGEP